MTRIGRLLAILACMVPLGCTNMFFVPTEQLIRTPADIGLHYSEVKFKSDDGTPLYGWYLPAEGKAHGSILFLHGNAENISTHIASVYWLPSAGYNVFMFDYRGYGRSGGVPEIDGVIRDAEAAIGQLIDMLDTSEEPVIVYGQSIGAAIAIHAVAQSEYRNRIDALIAEGAFSSYRDIAREKLAAFWLTWPLQYPLAWTISDRYAPIDTVAKVSPVPLLLVYSEEDAVVPVHHGELLYAAAMEPKQLWRIPHGRHINIFAEPEQKQHLLEYLKSVTRRK